MSVLFILKLSIFLENILTCTIHLRIYNYFIKFFACLFIILHFKVLKLEKKVKTNTIKIFEDIKKLYSSFIQNIFKIFNCASFDVSFCYKFIDKFKKNSTSIKKKKN